MLGPNVAAGLRVNKLNRNTDARATAPDTAFQDVTDPQFPGDSTDIDGLSLIREGRIAGDNQQGTKFRKAGNDVFRHAVREILLLRVIREGGKRQHGD